MRPLVTLSLVFLFAMLSTAPAARAATVSLANTVNAIEGEGARVVEQAVVVSVNAPAGEQNAITLTTTATEVRIEDSAAPLTAAAGCVQESPTVARCAVVKSARKTDVYSMDIHVELGDGDDRLTFSPPLPASPRTALRVNGGDGADEMTAPGAVANGEAGDDRLLARMMSGGTGNDTLIADGAGGGAGARSSGSLLAGNAGDDALIGGGHDDTFDPGTGNDTVDGGDGNDVLRYLEHPHGMRIDLASVPGTADGAEEHDTLAGIEAIEGSELGDVIVGGDGDELLDGGRGPDRIFGGNGDDTLLAASAKAQLHGGEGDDYLVALRPGSDCGPGTDTFAAFDGPLRLGRVRASCELAEPLLPEWVGGDDPRIDVASVRVRRGRLQITFVAGGARPHRIDVELYRRGKRLAFAHDVLLRGGLHRRTSFRVPLTALGRRLLASRAPVRSMLYLDADADITSQVVQIDRPR